MSAGDVRYRFPLPHERPAQPRFDGRYHGPDGQHIAFDRDGTLRWNGEPGTWSVHGATVYVRTETRDCEGAIGLTEIYLICAAGSTLAGRTQLVLTLVSQPA
jgi:hypothetical protein